MIDTEGAVDADQRRLHGRYLGIAPPPRTSGREPSTCGSSTSRTGSRTLIICAPWHRGFDVYRAVLDHGVRTAAEFTAWHGRTD